MGGGHLSRGENICKKWLSCLTEGKSWRRMTGSQRALFGTKMNERKNKRLPLNFIFPTSCFVFTETARNILWMQMKDFTRQMKTSEGSIFTYFLLSVAFILKLPHAMKVLNWKHLEPTYWGSFPLRKDSGPAFQMVIHWYKPVGLR